eukprot:1966572-Pleurochrysis_carterae.AAC.1
MAHASLLQGERSDHSIQMNQTESETFAMYMDDQDGKDSVYGRQRRKRELVWVRTCGKDSVYGRQGRKRESLKRHVFDKTQTFGLEPVRACLGAAARRWNTSSARRERFCIFDVACKIDSYLKTTFEAGVSPYIHATLHGLVRTHSRSRTQWFRMGVSVRGSVELEREGGSERASKGTRTQTRPGRRSL